MRLVIAVPLLALLVLFALSNTHPVRLGLWPTDFALELPLSLAVLAGMAIGFLAGGMVVWFGEWSRRRQAREADHRVRLLEAQVAQMRAGDVGRRLDPPA